MVYDSEGTILVEINIWTYTVSTNSSQSWQVFMLTKSFVLEKNLMGTYQTQMISKKEKLRNLSLKYNK